MNESSVFDKFKVVDTLRNPASPHAHAKGPSKHERDLLLHAVKSMRIDPKVIHSVSIDYLSSMKASSDDVAKGIVEWLMKNKAFEQSVFQATREAIIFSTLAGVLLPDAYGCSLSALEPLKWPELRRMRKTLFMIGIDMLLEDAGDDRLKAPVARTNSEAFLRCC